MNIMTKIIAYVIGAIIIALGLLAITILIKMMINVIKDDDKRLY